jgi:hypothetical protein
MSHKKPQHSAIIRRPATGGNFGIGTPSGIARWLTQRRKENINNFNGLR